MTPQAFAALTSLRDEYLAEARNAHDTFLDQSVSDVERMAAAITHQLMAVSASYIDDQLTEKGKS